MTVDPRCIEILKRNEAFLGLPDDLLAELAALPSCRVRHYKVGQAIFRAGQAAETVAILANGSADITVPVDTDKGTHHEEIVDTVHKGSILGWSSMVPPYIFTRNAVATSDCELLIMDWKELRQLMESEPRVGYELAMAILRILHMRYLHVQQLLVSGRRQTTI